MPGKREFEYIVVGLGGIGSAAAYRLACRAGDEVLGIVPASEAMQTHARMARAHGATLLERSPVTGIRPLAGGVEVTTPDGDYRCRRLVLATDAWTNRLVAPLGLRLPLTMTQEQVAFF